MTFCYCSLLPPQQLLPAMRQVSSKFRNSASAYKSRYFSDINTSRGSVATHSRYGGIFNNFLLISYSCISERIFKIGEYLLKI